MGKPKLSRLRAVCSDIRKIWLTSTTVIVSTISPLTPFNITTAHAIDVPWLLLLPKLTFDLCRSMSTVR